MTAHSSAKVRPEAGSSTPEINSRSLSRAPSASHNFYFWYWGVALCLGLAQIAVVAWSLVSFARHGINATTMRLAFIAAGFTTMSLVLFKILGARPARRTLREETVRGHEMKPRCPDPHADSTRLARILFALADPVRLRMLNLMIGGEVSSKDIVRVLRVDAEVVSRHVISLQSGGLISTHRIGLTWHYSIRRDTARNDVECQVIQLVLTAFRSQPDMQADLALLHRISEQRPKPKAEKCCNAAGSAQVASAPAIDATSNYIDIATQAHPSAILRSAEIPSTEQIGKGNSYHARSRQFLSAGQADRVLQAAGTKIG